MCKYTYLPRNVDSYVLGRYITYYIHNLMYLTENCVKNKIHMGRYRYLLIPVNKCENVLMRSCCFSFFYQQVHMPQIQIFKYLSSNKINFCIGTAIRFAASVYKVIFIFYLFLSPGMYLAANVVCITEIRSW